MAGNARWIAMILVALAAGASANEIVVHPRVVRLDQPIQISIVLEGPFASITHVAIRASNLRIEGSPSVASEFRFVNGRFARRKVLTYVAFANRHGNVVISPIRLVGDDGKIDTLPEVTIDVLPPAAVAPNQPGVPPSTTPLPSDEAVFVAVEIDRPTVYVGEQAIVNWVLYSNPGSVRGFRIRKQPALDGFWTEEFPVTNEDPVEVDLGGRALQKSTLRRSALFPMRAGETAIGPLEVDVQVMEPFREPFGRFGSLEMMYRDVRRRSSAAVITAVPAGAAADAVGTFTMTCRPPKASAAGPVAIEAIVDGRGSLRSSGPPRFATPPDATVEVQEGGVVAGRGPYEMRMRRSWTLLLFPRREGRMEVPPLRFDAFDPSRSAVVPLTCGGWEVNVALPRGTATAPAPRVVRMRPNRSLQVGSAVAALAALAVLAVWARRRRRGIAPEGEAFLAHGSEPRAMRRRLAEIVLARGTTPEALFHDPSEEGERFRALHSLVDLLEKEPWRIEESQEELRRRVREFFSLPQSRLPASGGEKRSG